MLTSLDHRMINIASVEEQQPVIEAGSTCPLEDTIEIVTNDMITNVCNSDGVISMLGDDGDSNGATALLSLADMALIKTSNADKNATTTTTSSTTNSN